MLELCRAVAISKLAIDAPVRVLQHIVGHPIARIGEGVGGPRGITAIFATHVAHRLRLSAHGGCANEHRHCQKDISHQLYPLLKPRFVINLFP